MIEHRLILCLLAHGMPPLNQLDSAFGLEQNSNRVPPLLKCPSHDYPTGTKAPLTWPASSDARKSKICAMDSGLTHFDGSAVGMLCRFAGVSIVVGKMPFTVTPVPVSSRASTRINDTRAAFDTI